MTYPSTHADLENDIDSEPPPERSSKSKGKQKEILPLNKATSSIRPLPRVPPFGLGITTPGIGDMNWEGNESATGFIMPAGHSSSSLATPTATTSSASSTTSSSSIHNSSTRSSAATSSSSHNFMAPLRSSLVNSQTSLAASSRFASPSSTKFHLTSRTLNSSSYGPSVLSSSASTNLPSTSSSKSPIPSSWASRPIDLSSQIPPHNNVNRGHTLPTPSNSRPPSQIPTPPPQQFRSRISSVTGVRPPLGTSLPVVAYGNRNRSGSMGAGSSGSAGSRTIMGARTRSQSRTRAGTVNVSILPTGNGSSLSRRSSRDRDHSVDASSQQSTSMPSSPVMNSLHMPFSTSPGTVASGLGMAETSTTSFTPSSARPPRILPSPVLPSGSLNIFPTSSSPVSIARSTPRNQAMSSSPRQPSVLSSSIANTTGKRALPQSPPSIPVGRPLGRREPSISRSISQNTPLRKLPQPSLSAHIASISASPPRGSSFASSASPPMTGLVSSPSISVQPNFGAQAATTTATHRPKIPKDILTATTPLSYSSYSASSSSIGRESELHVHPMTSDVMGILASKNRLDDDRSSLSSFKASRRVGTRGSHSDLEDFSYHKPDELEDVLGSKGVLNRVDGNAHIHVHVRLHVHDRERLDVYADSQNYRALSRSPSPMRYARPESMGWFSSSEDDDMGMGKRGRRGREGVMRPPMTWTVAGSDALGVESDGSDGESVSATGMSEAGSESKRRGRRKTQLRAFRNSYRSGPFVNGSGGDVNSTVSGSGNVEGSIGSNEVEGSAESSKGSDRWWKKLKVKDKIQRTKD